MNIYQFIEDKNLFPADAVELVNPNSPFPRHYAIFLGIRNGQPEFIANIVDGVQIICGPKLMEFTAKFQVSNIERFVGSVKQRKAALKKAVKRVGEKPYHFIFNNCEHFKNWVLHGQSVSKQVIGASFGMLAVGGLFYFIGRDSNRKSIQKVAIVAIAIAIIILLINFIAASVKSIEPTKIGD